MKTVQYRLMAILGILVLSPGCRGYQEKSKVESSWHSTWDTGNYRHYGFLKQDTNTYTRFWFYQTDSGFRFDTDSGLIGKAGLLAAYEYGKKTSSIGTYLDSVAIRAQTSRNTYSEQNQKKKPYPANVPWWLTVVVFTGVAIVIRWFLRSRH